MAWIAVFRVLALINRQTHTKRSHACALHSQRSMLVGDPDLDDDLVEVVSDHSSSDSSLLERSVGVVY